jgi:large subunit ribosomal protein L18
MAKTSIKTLKRESRKRRIRSRVKGSEERLRVSVFRSNKNIFAQIVNDTDGKTLVSAHTREVKAKNKTEGARALGVLLSKKASEKKINKVVFDRGGYIFTGRVKAFAEALREGGLSF